MAVGGAESVVVTVECTLWDNAHMQADVVAVTALSQGSSWPWPRLSWSSEVRSADARVWSRSRFFIYYNDVLFVVARDAGESQ